MSFADCHAQVADDALHVHMPVSSGGKPNNLPLSLLCFSNANSRQASTRFVSVNSRLLLELRLERVQVLVEVFVSA